MAKSQRRLTVMIKPEAIADLVQRGVLRPVVDHNLDLEGATVLGATYDWHCNALAITFQGETLSPHQQQMEWNHANVVLLEVAPK